MRKILTASLTLAAIMHSTTGFTAEPVCKHFFDEMQGKVNVILADKHHDFIQKRAGLTTIFEQAVDVEWIAQTVAETYWDKASPAERSDFVKAYRPYLAMHYIGGLDEEDFNEMLALNVISANALSNDGYLLQTEVKRTADDAMHFDVTLAEQPKGSCHVHDFTMEGVSQVSTQRSEIQSLASQGGLKFVTEKLMELTHPAP